MKVKAVIASVLIAGVAHAETWSGRLWRQDKLSTDTVNGVIVENSYQWLDASFRQGWRDRAKKRPYVKKWTRCAYRKMKYNTPIKCSRVLPSESRSCRWKETLYLSREMGMVARQFKCTYDISATIIYAGILNVGFDF